MGIFEERKAEGAQSLIMPLYIPHKCPKCYESVTLIQPQHKGGAFKGPAKGQCLNCMDEEEYDLTKPVNRRTPLETVNPKLGSTYAS
jgi:hypothetical protein